jgi:hypothetical protein
MYGPTLGSDHCRSHDLEKQLKEVRQENERYKELLRFHETARTE